MLLGPQYAQGVIVTQVVPAVDGYSSLILEYKAALAKYFGGEASVLCRSNIISPPVFSSKRSNAPDRNSIREKLVETLETIRDLDLGLGTAINFNKSEHQGSHKVWGTQLNEAGNYEPIEAAVNNLSGCGAFLASIA